MNGLVDIARKSKKIAETMVNDLPSYQQFFSEWDAGVRKIYVEALSIIYNDHNQDITEILKIPLHDRDSRVRAVSFI